MTPAQMKRAHVRAVLLCVAGCAAILAGLGHGSELGGVLGSSGLALSAVGVGSSAQLARARGWEDVARFGEVVAYAALLLAFAGFTFGIFIDRGED